MKTKHTIIFVLTAVFAAVLLSGCIKNAAPDERKGISVVVTIFPPYDFTRAVAGELVGLTMLLPPGAESHSYEPTPQDYMKIRDCDLFIYNGGDSDNWVETILSSVDKKNMAIIKLIDCVETLNEEQVEGMQDSSPEEEDEADEHVWTSPKNAVTIVNAITEALSGIDPANETLYRANAAAYKNELNGLDSEIRAVVANGARRELIFGDRFPFRYFTEEYGLIYYAAFPGCSSETEASPATILFLKKKVAEDRIPVVLHIELGNVKTAETVAEGSGAMVRELHSCHNITLGEFESGKTYIDIMKSNLEVLREALS